MLVFRGVSNKKIPNAPSCNTTQRGQRWFGEGLSMLFTLIVLVHGSLALKDGSDKDEIPTKGKMWWIYIRGEGYSE